MELDENPWADTEVVEIVPLPLPSPSQASSSGGGKDDDEGDAVEVVVPKVQDKEEPVASSKNTSKSTPATTTNTTTTTNISFPEPDMKQPGIQGSADLIYAICVIDFHHIRGPEIEFWYDNNSNSNSEEDQGKQKKYFTEKWPNLPFQALPDGAHLFEETFSNFTLLDENRTTLFGCACIRQLDASQLLRQSDEVTRSIVQKSVVIISRYPITIQMREKLSIVTRSFFEQRDFEDKKVIVELFDNLSLLYNSVNDNEVMLHESDFYMGLTLKEMVVRYKRDLLVIFKAMMLEKRIIFFGKDLLRLSNFQFSLISLIPNLILNLQQCGSSDIGISREDVELNYKDDKQPRSFNILDRASILKFIGLPLKIFEKKGFFEPYLALQQLDSLKEADWYMIGTSNDLLLDQKHKIADMIVYIDHPTCKNSIEFLNQDLESSLQLTSQDKKFIDSVIRQVSAGSSSTADNENNGEDQHLHDNTTIGNSIYADLMMEDMIRSKFENYLIGFLSSCKYETYMRNASSSQLESLNRVGSGDGDKIFMKPDNLLNRFNRKFVNKWKEETLNYKIFDKCSYNEFFTMQEFKPCHLADMNAPQSYLAQLWQNRRSTPTTTTANTNTSTSATTTTTPQKRDPAKKNFIQQSWSNYWNPKQQQQQQQQ